MKIPDQVRAREVAAALRGEIKTLLIAGWNDSMVADMQRAADLLEQMSPVHAAACNDPNNGFAVAALTTTTNGLWYLQRAMAYYEAANLIEAPEQELHSQLSQAINQALGADQEDTNGM